MPLLSLVTSSHALVTGEWSAANQTGPGSQRMVLCISADRFMLIKMVQVPLTETDQFSLALHSAPIMGVLNRSSRP